MQGTPTHVLTFSPHPHKLCLRFGYPLLLRPTSPGLTPPACSPAAAPGRTILWRRLLGSTGPLAAASLTHRS